MGLSNELFHFDSLNRFSLFFYTLNHPPRVENEAAVQPTQTGLSSAVVQVTDRRQKEAIDGVAAAAFLVASTLTMAFSSRLISNAFDGRDVDPLGTASMMVVCLLPAAAVPIYKAIYCQSRLEENHHDNVTSEANQRRDWLAALGRKAKPWLPEYEENTEFCNRFLITVSTVYAVLITWMATLLVNVNRSGTSLTPTSERLAFSATALFSLVAVSALVINRIFHQRRQLSSQVASSATEV